VKATRRGRLPPIVLLHDQNMRGSRTPPLPNCTSGRCRGFPDPVRGRCPALLRIFGEYAAGRSMKAIAHRLNLEGVPFPAKDTKRGPVRRGWAVSTIQVMLRNEKYAGLWIWNKSRFLKDPTTGRRRPVARPPHEWVKQDRPDLCIVERDLWAAVQARINQLEETYGVTPGGPPRGGAHVAYSKYLLSGLVRCASCGARMVAQTATRRRNGRIHRYGWYLCGFARNKGPAVCGHRISYRQDRLESALINQFREAMTPAMTHSLCAAVNTRLVEEHREHCGRATALKDEILRLEREAGNLVRAIRDGLDSATVRSELRVAEEALGALRVSLAQTERNAALTPPRAHPEWIRTRLARLDELLREDPRGRVSRCRNTSKAT
jgi:site-specific DNA recombinase